MSTAEMRQKLIDKIQETDNEALLSEMMQLLDIEHENAIYHLSDNQKETIQRAKEQIQNGYYLTNEQSDQDIDGWLNQ